MNRRVNKLCRAISKKLPEDKYLRFSLVVIALSILIRFAITFLVTPSGDSFSHLNAARFIAENNYLPLFEPVYRPFFYYPPLFHIIAAGLYKAFILFGEATATKAMNFVAPIFGSASLIVFYKYAKRLVSSKILFFSTIFLSFIPMHMYYSTLAHVDIAAMFMVILIMYFATNSRPMLAGVIGGLGMLTKYTVMFIFPTVIYKFWQKTKKADKWVKQVGLYFLATLVIGAPLYIRNLVKLGNPLWPFLNNVVMAIGLQPLLVETRPAPALFSISELGIAVLRGYLDTYGVPLGIPEHLLGLPIFASVGWLGMTVLFTIPLIVGFFTKKPTDLTKILAVWIGTYMVMYVYYLYDFGVPFFRLVLPMFPALAIIWGYGFSNILSKIPKKRHILLFVLLLIICIGFTGVEFVKPSLSEAAKAPLNQDYKWIRDNIPIEGSYFDFHQPDLIFNTRRNVVSMLKTVDDYEGDIYHYTSKHQKEKYQDTSAYQEWELIYDNSATGGKIFKRPTS